MKKYFIYAVVASIFLSLNSSAFAGSDTGNIDFYKVFSKNNENIDMIGNKIYNWSIYLPNDATINKNPKATSFEMYTNSFKTNVSIDVLKNTHSASLEQLFVKTFRDNSSGYSEYDNSYICSSSIQENKDKNKYIVISSIIPESYLYKASNDEEEKGIYAEQRIYLGKSSKTDYIYIVNLAMDLQFYNQHKNLFSKIADSFKPTFDAKNPNIKDLSDQLTDYRIFENKIYGWKIELAPYWKAQANDAAMNQIFKPLYSDQEINPEGDASESDDTEDSSLADPDETKPSYSMDSSNEDSALEEDNTSSTKKDSSPSSNIKDSLSISVISSVMEGQSFEEWVNNEIKNIKLYRNQKLYTILAQPQDIKLNNAIGKLLISKIRKTSKDSIIQGTLFAEGQHFRYIVILEMKEDKYNEKEGKYIFNRMLNSFEVTNLKNRNITQITPLNYVFNYNAPRTISMNKYNLEITADNNWLEIYDLYDGQLDDSYSYYEDYSSNYESLYPTTSEYFTFNHSDSGAWLNISADFSADSLDDTVDKFLKDEFENQDITTKIASLKALKAIVENITIYKITKNYNIDKMQELSGSDSRKTYNYTTLNNSCTYILKTGEELYYISFSLPLINSSTENLKLIQELWTRLSVNNLKIGAKAVQWESVNISKYENKLKKK